MQSQLRAEHILTPLSSHVACAERISIEDGANSLEHPQSNISNSCHVRSWKRWWKPALVKLLCTTRPVTASSKWAVNLGSCTFRVSRCATLERVPFVFLEADAGSQTKSVRKGWSAVAVCPTARSWVWDPCLGSSALQRIWNARRTATGINCDWAM